MLRIDAQRCSGISALKGQSPPSQKLQSSKIITHTLSMIKRSYQEDIKGPKAENNETENFSRNQAPSLNLSSKKISKSKDGIVNRRVLGDLTNRSASSITPALTKKNDQETQSEREFKEDLIIKTSSCPINLKYLNKRAKKMLSFKCYRDRDLKFPSDYSNKTFDQNCDNDCSTDEDQIFQGIKNLYRSLEGQVRLMKELGKKPEQGSARPTL